MFKKLFQFSIFVLIFALIVVFFPFRHVVVSGTSMMNTLQDGEHLITSNFFYSPERSDIIVFKETSTGKTMVKRVIAVGGDSLEITWDGRVYVNDQLLKEDYVYFEERPYYYSKISMTVPQGEIFVMGDHRDSSMDSREFGCIDADSIIGKVVLRVFPFDAFGALD